MMTTKKTAIWAGCAVAALSVLSLVHAPGANRAEAVENSYVPAFFAGGRGAHGRDWCKGLSATEEIFVSSAVATWLDLDVDQRTALGEVVYAADNALSEAKALCPDTIKAQHALPLPEQIATMREQLAEADTVLAAIAAPLADFHAGLTPEQQKKLDDTMKDHNRGDGRRQRWHRQ